MSIRRLLPFFFTTAVEPLPAGAQRYIIGPWPLILFRVNRGAIIASGGRMQLRVSQLAVVAFLALPAPAAFGQLFGSIAYSEKDRQYGWANNYPTRAAAEKAAVESCRTSGKNCRSVLWFR